MSDFSAKPCSRITVHQIESATKKKFRDSNLIGRGRFGDVYKARFSNNSGSCAIKRLNDDSKWTISPDFETEVEWLSTLRHPNIVSLIGYCNGERKTRRFSTLCPWRFEYTYEREVMVVYEYVPNGTLEDHLLGLHPNSMPLSWTQRLKICLDVSYGLRYLHTCTGTKTGVIHGDIRPSNILLDERWRAKISDSGLQEIVQPNLSAFKPAFGYIDPRYVVTGVVSRMYDIYSFGVVLLEVLCGRLAIDDESHPNAEWNLVNWLRDSVKERNLMDLIDSSIRNEISSECLEEFYRLAEGCLRTRPKERPGIGEVTNGLEFVLGLQEGSNNQWQSAGRKTYDTPPFLLDEENYVQGDPKVSSNSKKEVPVDSQSPIPGVKAFKLADLRITTSDFTSDLLLGDTAKEYFGSIDQMTPATKKFAVTVKRLNQDGLQGDAEFQAEVNLLGYLVHPNIQRPLGYCIEERERFLISEYMSDKTLDHFLGTDALSWRTRLSILLQVARGLEYLHSRNIVHCDLKSSNVLLDEDFNAKIKLSGLCIYEKGVASPLACTGRTPGGGYIDPDYWATGRVSREIDMYAFGVLMAFRRFGHDDDVKRKSLAVAAWASKTQQRFRRDVIYDYPGQAASKVLALALRCLAANPKDRPSSTDVLMNLERLAAIYKL